MESFLARVVERANDARPVSRLGAAESKAAVRPRKTSALARLHKAAAEAAKPKAPLPKPGPKKAPVHPTRSQRAPPSAIRRAFDAYCERAVQNSTLSPMECEIIRTGIEKFSDDERAQVVGVLEEAEMQRLMEEGLRGKEVQIVGATGRHPRGWWGDGSVGRVMDGDAFDQRTPGLLPVRLPLTRASAARGAIPDVAVVGIRAVNLRMLLRSPTSEGLTQVKPSADSAEQGRGGLVGDFPPELRLRYASLLAARGRTAIAVGNVSAVAASAATYSARMGGSATQADVAATARIPATSSETGDGSDEELNRVIDEMKLVNRGGNRRARAGEVPSGCGEAGRAHWGAFCPLLPSTLRSRSRRLLAALTVLPNLSPPSYHHR